MSLKNILAPTITVLSGIKHLFKASIRRSVDQIEKHWNEVCITKNNSMADVRHRLARLIAGVHILHKHGVLDETGTISFRNRNNPATFVTSSLAPVLTSSPDDLDERYVADASPVIEGRDGAAASGSPRNTQNIHIHSSIYARYPDVQSIGHIRTIDLVVYGLCDANGSMLRSVFSEAGFVDEYCPIFDPAHSREALPPDHPHNLKVDHPILGAALAETLSSGPRDGSDGGRVPEHGVGFVRGNGAVVWSSDSLEDLVYRCVNLQRNAKIQTAAMLQRAGSDLEITYLSANEAMDCTSSNGASVQLSWDAWATEVARDPLYHNELQGMVV